MNNIALSIFTLHITLLFPYKYRLRINKEFRVYELSV